MKCPVSETSSTALTGHDLSGRRVLVALSGGVDSAVAALLLTRAGADVSATYIRSWVNEPGNVILADCPWEEDIRNAEAVASHIGIPFQTLDLVREYRERVVQYLIDGYRSGRTPNPDILCNREMKFGLLRAHALEAGCDFVATGHYCRRLCLPSGEIGIGAGTDPEKDQSYFLAMLSSEQAASALFPIGGLTKSEVRAIARDSGLPNAGRKDSQGICFLGKIRINEFLAQYIPDSPGEIVRATDGVVLGQHRGLHRFTIGQRKGIGVPSNTDFENYVVVGKDFETNHLRVAFDGPSAPGLYRDHCRLGPMNWINGVPEDWSDFTVKVRYRDPNCKARLVMDHQSDATLEFDIPQRGLAPGQVVAFYQRDQLLGGAFFR